MSTTSLNSEECDDYMKLTMEDSALADSLDSNPNEMCQDKKMTKTVRKYVTQNSVNEQRENVIKNKEADEACHCLRIEIPPESEQTHIPLLQGKGADIRNNDTNTDHLDSGLTKQNFTNDSTTVHMESGDSFSSTQSDMKSTQAARWFCWMKCCTFFMTVLLILLLCLIGGAVYFFMRTNSEVHSVDESRSLPAVGIPSAEIPIFGLYTIDQSKLVDSETVRWVQRGQTANYGMTESEDDSCVTVQFSGLYKIESQITFKFRPTETTSGATHTIVIKRTVNGKEESETVIRRQVPRMVSSETIHTPSNIGVLAEVMANEKICVNTYPNTSIYVSPIDNALDIELRILYSPKKDVGATSAAPS